MPNALRPLASCRPRTLSLPEHFLGRAYMDTKIRFIPGTSVYTQIQVFSSIHHMQHLHAELQGILPAIFLSDPDGYDF